MAAPFVPRLVDYRTFLTRTRGLSFPDYAALQRWSAQDLDGFWQSIFDYFELSSATPFTTVLARDTMPGAEWFPGARLNWASQILRHAGPAHAAGHPAIIAEDESGVVRTIGWPDLLREVAALAGALARLGVVPGDRVVAYLPNVPETIIACLASLSIGAVWSVCAPDMGTPAVLDRFTQITPKVLIAADGIRYGGKAMDRAGVVEELAEALPSVEHLIVLSTPNAARRVDRAHHDLATLLAGPADPAFRPIDLPFDHPLWIVYSSGTTGLPKPIVHGHGNVLLPMLSMMALGNDLGASYEANSFGERYHWYSSTGWIMWNAQMSGLAVGATIVIYDGSPAGTVPGTQDWSTLWRFAARHQVTWFGAGAAFFANCMKAGLDLGTVGDLSRIRALGTTGSPLAPDVQRWGTAQFEAIGTRDIWWCNISGGTDLMIAFVGGNRELPLEPGVMQCRMLGVAVEAWNEAGEPVIDEVGELVCTRPIPSMPIRFWNDPGDARLISSYFDVYPGVWRHGDWLKITREGGCIIYGRSDATINRFGLRMGTSEIYAAVEALPDVLDSMVVDCEYLGRDSYMPLFVVPRPGVVVDERLKAAISNAIRSALSPRFVPSEIIEVAEIPRTLSGKKQELPIKKLLLGQPVAKVINRDAMANPGCLDWYIAFAAAHVARG